MKINVRGRQFLVTILILAIGGLSMYWLSEVGNIVRTLKREPWMVLFLAINPGVPMALMLWSLNKLRWREIFVFSKAAFLPVLMFMVAILVFKLMSPQTLNDYARSMDPAARSNEYAAQYYVGNVRANLLGFSYAGMIVSLVVFGGVGCSISNRTVRQNTTQQ